MDDLVEKKMDKAKGQTRKKNARSTTCSNNYGQIYNVGQLGETWNARDREERAKQRWRPLRRA